MRPALAHIATPAEIRQKWDLVDVLDVNEALDLQQEETERMQDRLQAASRRGQL